MSDFKGVLEHVRALKRQVVQLEAHVDALEQHVLTKTGSSSQSPAVGEELTTIQRALSALHQGLGAAVRVWQPRRSLDVFLDRDSGSGVRWDSLPADILKDVFYNPVLPSSSYPHIRLVCTTWRSSFDSTLKTIQLRRLPESTDACPGRIHARFPALSEVDLSRLPKDLQRGWPRICSLLTDLAGLHWLEGLTLSKDCITVSQAMLRQGTPIMSCQGSRAPWHRTSADKDYMAALPPSLSLLTGLRALSVVPRVLQDGDSRRWAAGDARSFCSDAITCLSPLSNLSRLQVVSMCGTIIPATTFSDLRQVTSLALSSSFQSHTQMMEHLVHFSQLVKLSLSKTYNMPGHAHFTTILSCLTTLQHLDLSDNRLVQLPAGIGQLSLLLSLDVSRNKLSRLVPEITALQSLTRLVAATNLFRQFPVEASALVQLSHLDLSLTLLRMHGLATSQALNEFCNLLNVHTVHLCGVRLQMFPMRLLQLGSLLHLGLSHNHLQQLPNAISLLTNLRHLNVSHNRLAELPPAMASLSRLLLLDCKRNLLANVHLPTHSLTYLDLSQNNITQLPNNFTRLTKLQYLSLTCNPMSPEGFQLGRLLALTELQLGSLGLSSGMGPLPGQMLQVVVPWDNLLGPGPGSLALGALSNLDCLNLSANPLGRLPADLAQLQQLSYVNISRAGLVSLEPALLALRGLTYLDASVNHLQELSSGVSSLCMLRFLDVSSNALEVLPAELWGLPCLRQLLACANLLSELPEITCNNSTLVNLDIRLNQLQGLPTSLSRLLALDEILLDPPLDTWPAALALRRRRVTVSTSTAEPRNTFDTRRNQEHRAGLPMQLGQLLPFMHPAVPDDVLQQVAGQMGGDGWPIDGFPPHFPPHEFFGLHAPPDPEPPMPMPDLIDIHSESDDDGPEPEPGVLDLHLEDVDADEPQEGEDEMMMMGPGPMMEALGIPGGLLAHDGMQAMVNDMIAVANGGLVGYMPVQQVADNILFHG